MIGRWIARLDQYHFQSDPQATHATQKCRWSQQEDQRLRASGEDRRKTTGCEQGIQFHVPKGLRRTPHCAIYRHT